MRFENQTVRIGENVGPIDWTYDFRSHFNSYATSDAERDRFCAESVGWLRRIEHDFLAGIPIRVTNYGGSPRCGLYRVIAVGMYDGWPWWRPVPSVQVQTHMGSDWYGFYSITDIFPGESGLERVR
jgi:hypothetical protein